MMEHKKKITILISVIRYFIGVFFLLIGIAAFFEGEILTSLFSILIGVLLTPAIADPIEKKLKISLSAPLRFIAVLCLIMAIGATADPVEPSERIISPISPIGSENQQVNGEGKVVAPEVKADTQKVTEDSPEPVKASTQKVKSSQEPATTSTPAAEPTPILNNEGKLDILTSPAGATITIDGVSKGLSPIEGLSVDTGKHTVNVQLSGYNPEKEKIEIVNSETKELLYTLVPETKKSSTPTPVQPVKESNPKQVTTEIGSTTNYQDAQWLDATSRNAPIVGNDMTNVAEAADNLDYVSLSNSGSALYYDSVAAIDESNMYEVSPALQPTKDEFEEALYDSRDAGSNTVSGIYEFNQGRTDESVKLLTLAIDNIDDCQTHMETAIRMLDKYQSNL